VPLARRPATPRSEAARSATRTSHTCRPGTPRWDESGAPGPPTDASADRRWRRGSATWPRGGTRRGVCAERSADRVEPVGPDDAASDGACALARGIDVLRAPAGLARRSTFAWRRPGARARVWLRVSSSTGPAEDASRARTGGASVAAPEASGGGATASGAGASAGDTAAGCAGSGAGVSVGAAGGAAGVGSGTGAGIGEGDGAGSGAGGTTGAGGGEAARGGRSDRGST
jgi:hypothetical protein